MANRAREFPKPTGKLVVECKAHGQPYSVYFYDEPPGWNRSYATDRIEYFRTCHIDFAPQCADAIVKEIAIEYKK